MAGIYDNDGKTRLTASPGTGFCGLYAPDGSYYYTLAPGSGFCGSIAPDGSWYVTDASGAGFGGLYAPNGALRITTVNEWNGALRVSGSFGPTAGANFIQSTYALNLAALSSVATFSRAGNAMQFDSQGYLTYGPNNLLTYSNTFSNAAWTKFNISVSNANAVSDPFGGAQASTFTATGANGQIYQTSTGNSSTNYVSAWWMRRRTGSGTIKLWAADNNIAYVDATATLSDNQWHLISISHAGAATVAWSYPLIVTNGDAIDVYAATLSAVTYETTPRPGDQVITTASAYYGPRIDYDPNTLAVKGLLIEEARTNLAINSASLSSFSPFSMTTTTNFAVAPDGTSAATKLDDGTTAAVPHQVAYSPSGLSASTAYAFSVFAKQGTGRYLTLSNVGSSSANGGYAVFDLQAGTVTQSAALGAGSLTSATITPINGGWYRLSVVAVAGTNTARFLFVLGSNSGTYTADSNGRNSYTGTNNTWLVWGAQLELGSFATSYIPTAAASVTRAAETVQLTGSALAVMQGASGTAFVQTTDMATNSSTSQTLLGLANGGTMGYPLFYWPANTKITTVNASVTLSTAVTPTLTSPVRAGIAWSAAGRSIANNGGTVATDANPFSSAAVTGAYLGVGNGGALYWLNGHIASAAFYNSRLPDATLQVKSVVGASYV